MGGGRLVGRPCRWDVMALGEGWLAAADWVGYGLQVALSSLLLAPSSRPLLLPCAVARSCLPTLAPASPRLARRVRPSAVTRPRLQPSIPPRGAGDTDSQFAHLEYRSSRSGGRCCFNLLRPAAATPSSSSARLQLSIERECRALRPMPLWQTVRIVPARLFDDNMPLARPPPPETFTSLGTSPDTMTIGNHTCKMPPVRRFCPNHGSDAFGRRRNITLTPAPLQAHHEKMSRLAAGRDAPPQASKVVEAVSDLLLASGSTLAVFTPSRIHESAAASALSLACKRYAPLLECVRPPLFGLSCICSLVVTCSLDEYDLGDATRYLRYLERKQSFAQEARHWDSEADLACGICERLMPCRETRIAVSKNDILQLRRLALG
ncbi:hypothetical protein CC86DRAFT_457424 [Ophiobolus disseminans]|uniref:Uncharacterized protein n=1 Tax=Ophiobolus disseminans TaxID=1469910 RepID=A0A6A6ZRQ4_9PLEO|nr:hypothetical protein CC86DRAFT_457424 [Ophiobolus disseminans]